MSSIKKNFLYNVSYQILIMFIPLITTPYISRVLGSNGIGTFSYAYSVSTYYVMFIMLGLNNYGNRTIAKVRDDKKILYKTFWSIYVIQFVLGILISCIYFFYCFFISKTRFISLVLGLYVVSACFDVNWFFFGMEKFKLTVARNTIIKILSAVAIFIFVKSESDVLIYCLVMTLGMFLSQIALWPYILREFPFYKPSIKEVKIHIKPNLYLFLTVIAVSIFKVFDKVMLGMMTTKSEVGFYESSEKIISIPISLISALGTVMLPRMTNMFAKKDSRSNKLLYKSVLFAMVLSSSLSFGIMGISKEFVPLFYGEEFNACINVFLVLLPSCLFLAFANVVRTQYLLPRQMDSAYVTSSFLGAGVNIILNLGLITRFGAVGAAIGTLFAEAVVCIYQVWQVRNFISVKIYIKKSLPFIVSGIIMFFILFNFKIAGWGLLQLMILKLIMGIVIYLGLLILFLFFYRIIKKRAYFKLEEN